MNQVDWYQYIAGLIAKERLGRLSESEETELNDWLKEAPGHPACYERLKRKDVRLDIDAYHRIDVGRGWEKYRQAYPLRHRRRLYVRVSVAAALAIFMGSVLFYILSPKHSAEELAGIAPGSARAELILADGTVHYLDTTSGEEPIRVGNAALYTSDSSIRYVPQIVSTLGNETTAQLPGFNELRIPTGGEYQLILADGTKIWLNAQSRLKYPVTFTGNKREVELEGEAYFEVLPDTLHPFVVHLKDEVQIEVLGTSFNVRAYSDEKSVETVLEQGKVRMSARRKAVILTPGLRAVYCLDDGDIHTEKVTTKVYTAWRNGQFVFQNETMESIFRKLSRWYDIDVFFQNADLKDLHFSGTIERYKDIADVVKFLEKTGMVSFTINGKTLIVTE